MSSNSTSSPYFEPSCWGDYFLNVTPLDKEIKQQMELEIGNLREEVRKELTESASKPMQQLEVIDAIERLGVAYHFEAEIEEALEKLYVIYVKECDNYNLNHVSLGFRILRQHGFNVSSDFLSKFVSDKGFESVISKDLKGILSLYEASHVEIHEDKLFLEECLTYATASLTSTADQPCSPLSDQVAHALHQPLHTGVIRLESIHYISFYEQYPSHSKTLLRLAKLDFNLVQSKHQMEMKELIVWWKDLHAKVPYARDRSVECFFWILGGYYEPRYGFTRKIFSRMFMILQILDDIYDTYGTIEEKQLLSDAVQRWDYISVNQLPNCFSECYKALLDCFDEAEKELAIHGRSYRLHYMKEQMKLSCKAWFEEAKWCETKYIPTYEEYMEVSLISVSQINAFIASYLGMDEIASKEVFEWLSQTPTPKPVEAATMTLRLMNDIGGHKYERKREHVASSVECYMKQHGVTDEVQVYEELERKVKDAWKDINEGMLKPHSIPKALLDPMFNLSRSTMLFYKGRTEGYTYGNKAMQKNIASVLIHPIAI